MRCYRLMTVKVALQRLGVHYNLIVATFPGHICRQDMRTNYKQLLYPSPTTSTKAPSANPLFFWSSLTSIGAVSSNGYIG